MLLFGGGDLAACVMAFLHPRDKTCPWPSRVSLAPGLYFRRFYRLLDCIIFEF